MADREAIQAQLAALKGVFLSQLGVRLDELEAAWALADYPVAWNIGWPAPGRASPSRKWTSRRPLASSASCGKPPPNDGLALG